MEEDFFKQPTPGQLVDVDPSTVFGASMSKSTKVWNQQSYHDSTRAHPDIDTYTDVDLKLSASTALLDFRSSRFACFSRGSRTLRLRRCVDSCRTGQRLRWSADDWGNWTMCAYLKIYWGYEIHMSLVNHWEHFNLIQRATLRFCIWWGSIWCHLSARWFNGWIAFVKTGRLGGEWYNCIQLHVRHLVIWSCDPGESQHFSNFLRKLWSFCRLVVDSTQPG